MDVKILLFAFIIGVPFTPVEAQETTLMSCEGKLVEELDSITGMFTRSFKEKFIVQNSPEDMLDFDLKQFNEVLVFSVLATGAGDCLDEKSKMITKFTSGETLTLMMQGDFNCDREFVAFFGGTFGRKKEFRMFFANEIKRIKSITKITVQTAQNRTLVVQIRTMLIAHPLNQGNLDTRESGTSFDIMCTISNFV